jgi:hypothetical protein
MPIDQKRYLGIAQFIAQIAFKDLAERVAESASRSSSRSGSLNVAIPRPQVPADGPDGRQPAEQQFRQYSGGTSRTARTFSSRSFAVNGLPIT